MPIVMVFFVSVLSAACPASGMSGPRGWRGWCCGAGRGARASCGFLRDHGYAVADAGGCERPFVLTPRLALWSSAVQPLAHLGVVLPKHGGSGVGLPRGVGAVAVLQPQRRSGELDGPQGGVVDVDE